MFNCPLSIEKANRLIQQIELPNNSYVIDVGCGEGDFLIQFLKQYQVTAIGIDNKPDCIKLANENKKSEVLDKNISFICQDARLFDWAAREADLIIAIGSEFIFGGYRQTLEYFSTFLNDRGKLLIGTVFWKQEPPTEYLSLMGGENPHFDYFTTVDIAVQERFIPLYSCRSNQDEWDDFEGRFAKKRYIEAIKSNDEAAFEQTCKWQQGYLKWGIETMGFGFFLLQKR